MVCATRTFFYQSPNPDREREENSGSMWIADDYLQEKLPEQMVFQVCENLFQMIYC